jgi:type IV secretory pathway VirB10-like protein
MPRKLKTYQTSQGFYDLAIAAPSMKAALEAWGASSNLFHQGFAKEADDGKVIEAAMAKPGIVLQRPVGSNGPFKEHSELPSAKSLDAPSQRGREPEKKSKPVSSKAPKLSQKAEREAALAFEREQKRQQAQREKEEAEAAKVRARREVAISKAEAALAAGRKEHEDIVSKIETERAALDKRTESEEDRWETKKERLQAELRKAKG